MLYISKVICHPCSLKLMSSCLADIAGPFESLLHQADVTHIVAATGSPDVPLHLKQNHAGRRRLCSPKRRQHIHVAVRVQLSSRLAFAIRPRRQNCRIAHWQRAALIMFTISPRTSPRTTCDSTGALPRSGNNILLQGNLTGTLPELKLICSRCLPPS